MLSITPSNTIPLHVVYVTADSSEYKGDITTFCEKHGIRFTSRLFDSDKYSHDRYEIGRLPALHIYTEKILQMTVYMNESPVECIEACLHEYEEKERKRAERMKWWRNQLKKYTSFIKRMPKSETEIVETPVIYENPMH